MIDRLLALWQSIYPDSWVEPAPSIEPSFTTAMGQMQDATSPLTPFRKDANGGFWDSNMVRDPATFGYSYEDMHLDITNKTERQIALIRTISSLYGGSSPAGVLKRAARTTTGQDDSNLEGQVAVRTLAHTDWENEPNFSSRFVVPAPKADVLIRNGSYVEWLANVHVNEGRLNGSFSIHFFVGRLPESPSEYSSAPNLVGTTSVFAMPPRPGMPPRNGKVSSTVPLTAALLRLVSMQQLGSLQGDDVVPLLERRLKYRVVDHMGQVAYVTPQLELSIAIASSNVEAPGSDREFPRWGPFQTHFLLEGTME